MSYTPKHAKPASLRDATQHGPLGITETATGRHARSTAKLRRDSDAGARTRRPTTSRS
jgi:hypothetical protein